MGLRKRPDGTYQYRFKVGGRAFCGATKTSNKREAERLESEARQEAIAEIRKSPATTGKALMLGAAIDRFWSEVADPTYTGTYRQTVWTALEWLKADSGIGAHTSLRDLTPGLIEQAIGKRRGEGVKDATVNRTVTELLRRVWLRARDVWEVPVRPIEWKKHMRAEPKERIRSLDAGEEATIFESIPDDYRAVIAFMLKSGFRLHEAVNLRQRDIDWGRDGVIRVTGKGKIASTIPLSNELRAILTPLRAPTEFVFTYVAKRTSGGRIEGERYPITYEGLKTAWRRYGAPGKAGVADFRLHDLRHTAATRLGRKANIKVVQRFLRHENAATTAKYLHAFDDDVRAAMEAETLASGQKVGHGVGHGVGQND
jgi:integrase